MDYGQWTKDKGQMLKDTGQRVPYRIFVPTFGACLLGNMLETLSFLPVHSALYLLSDIF